MRKSHDAMTMARCQNSIRKCRILTSTAIFGSSTHFAALGCSNPRDQDIKTYSIVLLLRPPVAFTFNQQTRTCQNKNDVVPSKATLKSQFSRNLFVSLKIYAPSRHTAVDQPFFVQICDCNLFIRVDSLYRIS